MTTRWLNRSLPRLKRVMYFGDVFKQRKKLEELYLSIWKYSTIGCDTTHHSVINHRWRLKSNTKYWLNSVYTKWGQFQSILSFNSTTKGVSISLCHQPLRISSYSILYFFATIVISKLFITLL
jgi:hypothetical protein